MDELKLNSVNWEHGMLLTPEHFLRQEQYIDSLALWTLRYATPSFGLIGGGPRLPESERGSVRHDPIVVIDEEGETIGISVTQCRGITPAGLVVEIDPTHPVSQRFSKGDLSGVSEANVYVVLDALDKQATDGAVDEFNPQMKTERRQRYRLSLRLQPEEAQRSLSVARIRRPQYGSGYEKDPGYIPACTSLVSFSELAANWRKIIESMTLQADRYTELHRAMREFLVLFTERGIETETDAEAAWFVERMVVALQNTIYEILDPVQPPERFFGYLRRFFHSAAVFMDLAPGIQQYFDVLKETGETELIALVEQQKRLLKASRTWKVNENLAVDVKVVLQSLQTLNRLERALEGKYVDFRVSSALEGMNFVFDRGGKVLYRLSAKPSRVQGFADELTIHFSNLRLEGRDKYRLILVGEQNASFEKGYKIAVEIQINEGSGFRREPIILSCEARLEEQFNFEYDFDAPDVPTITDLRVTIQAHHPVRSALLYIRHRFYAGRSPEARGRNIELHDLSAEPVAERSRHLDDPPALQQTGFGEVQHSEQRPAVRRETQLEPEYDPRSESASEPAPWDLPRRSERLRDATPEAPPRPRRRRLE